MKNQSEINHEKINKTILKIRNIEAKARKMQQKINTLHREWNKLYPQVNTTEEWSNSCHESNVCTNYYFYDVLA
jgi:predicted transcriptional regulator